MCGVCGIVTYHDPPDLGLLMSMMGRLAHRGPDGCGYYRDRRVALGHTRLAIIDPEGGAQPLANEDETVWATFNGEIFNFVELVDELTSLGHRFRTGSDGEVIVHAWEEWGPASFERFDGQWALAIWDARTQRLVLCRDRLGVRPLFYTWGRDRFLFASEVKALFADASVAREIDPTGLNQVLTFWSAVAPTTVFRDVHQLPPGHFAILDGSNLRTQAYWRLAFPERGSEPGQDLASNAADLRARLIEAARLRFVRSDVPVGAYVSGGIDSAVTSSVVTRYTEAPLRTYSVRFADQEFDEGRYQELMTARLGTQHQSIEVHPMDIGDVFPEVVWHAETPILRTAPAPMLLLSRLVRGSGYKVVVTGEGADEVLGGYDIYREARVRQFWARNPDSAVRGRAVELLYPWMVRSPSQAPAFARGFFGRNLDPNDLAMSHRPRWDSTGVLKGLLSTDWAAELAESDVAAELVGSMPSDCRSWDLLGRAQWLEMTTLLPGYILSSQGDRMLMANSVEGRFPFLAPGVVGFANALPARHKLFGLEEKFVLKQAFADLVPPEILHRPKQPYRAPDAASFFGPAEPDWLAEVASDTAIAATGVFDPAKVAGLFAKARRSAGVGLSNTDNMRVLAVLSTQLTHQQFVTGDGSAPASAAGVELGPLTAHDRLKPEDSA